LEGKLKMKIIFETSECSLYKKEDFNEENKLIENNINLKIIKKEGKSFILKTNK
jgi:hypothetical protein